MQIGFQTLPSSAVDHAGLEAVRRSQQFHRRSLKELLFQLAIGSRGSLAR